MLKKQLPLIIGLAVVAGTGLVHGLWTERWHEAPELRAAVDRLAHMPRTIGQWQPAEAPLNPQEVRLAGAEGAWSRTYTHRRTRAQVRVIVLCGRAGPMSVHRPEHCYRGAGFEMVSAPVKSPVTAADGSLLTEVWTARFSGQDETGPRHLRIFWTWHAGATWQAADNPRFAFARYRALYKLYVVTEMAADDEDVEDDPGMELLQELVPELSKCLAPPAGGG
jgi:hypothetical protein